MKKLLLLLIPFLFTITAYSQNGYSSVFLRVTDSATFVNSANTVAKHAANYADIWYSVSSGLFWKWSTVTNTYTMISEGGNFWKNAGTTNVTNPTIDAGAGTMVLQADGAAIVFDGTPASESITFNASATNSLAMTPNTFDVLMNNGIITLASGSGVGTTLTMAATTQLTAQTNLNLTAGNNVSLTSTAGDVSLTTGASGDDALISATDDVTINAGTTGTDRDVNITTSNGHVHFTTGTAGTLWTTTGAFNINTDPGTAGDVLQSNGAGAAPTWVAPSGGGAAAIAYTDIAYVDVSGNDGTAVLGRSDLPYATIDGALTANTGVTNLKIKVGLGTYASPSVSNTRSNLWIEGSGKPGYNWVISQTAYATFSVTDPTALKGGTIFQGQLRFENKTNIKITDLGVDVGSAYVTGGGTEANALTIVQFPLAGPPITMMTNVVVKNFTALNRTAASAFHGISLENLYEPVLENIDTYFGTHGIAVKCIGGTITNTRGHYHSTDAIILKSDATGLNWATNVTNVEATNCGTGIMIESATGSLGNSQINVSGARLRDCTTGVYVFGAGVASAQFRLNNIHTIRCTTYGIRIEGATGGQISNSMVRGGTNGFYVALTSTNSEVTLTDVYASACGTGFNLTAADAKGIILRDYYADATCTTKFTEGSNIFVNDRLNTQTTAAGNVGTGEDNLFSYTVPANTLSTLRNSIHARFSVTFAANGNTKTLKVKFGATTIVSTAGAYTLPVVVDCEIIRTSGTTQDCNCSVVGGDTGITHSTFFNATETLSGTVALVVTGEATADNDIVRETGKVKFID